MTSFPKAKRFLEKIEQKPEVGDYDPKDVDPWKFKKGAFLESSMRFKHNAEKDDVPFHEGPQYSIRSTAKSPGLSSVSIAMNKKLKKDLDEMTERYNTLKDTSAKDTDILQAKIQKTVMAMTTLTKEKSAMETEVKQYRLKLADALAREESSRTAFEKARKAYEIVNEKSQKSASAFKKIEEMERIHALTKKSMQEEIDSLQAKLLEGHDRMHQYCKDSQTVRAELAEKKAQIEKLTKSHIEAIEKHKQLVSTIKRMETEYGHLQESTRVENESLQVKLSKAVRMWNEARDQADNDIDQQRGIISELQNELNRQNQEAAKMANDLVQMESQNENASAHADMLYSYIQDLEVNWTTLAHAHSRLLEFSRSTTSLHRSCRANIDDLEEQVECLEYRLVNLTRSNAAKDEEIKYLMETLVLLECTLEHERAKPVHDIEDGSDNESMGSYRDKIEAALNEFDAIVAVDTHNNLAVEHEQVVMALDETYRQLEEEEMNHLQAKKEIATARLTIESLQEQVSSMEVELIDVSTNKSSIQELQNQVIQLKVDLHRKDETIGRLNMSVAHEKVMQDCLVREMQNLKPEAEAAQEFQTAYEELQKYVEVLVKRFGLAEEEQRKLGLFNAALLGNANPKQRIKHVAHLREENARLKQEMLAANHERDRACSELDKVVKELESYKSIGTARPTKLSRVNRIPTVLGQRDENIHTVNLGDLIRKEYKPRSLSRSSSNDMENITMQW